MDLRKHLRDNPKITLDIVGSVKVLHVNNATLKLFGATTEKQFLSHIDTTFGPDAMEVFIEELCAIWEGKSTFRSEAVFLTFDGREITCIISFSIPETLEKFASVPVTILDISEQKALENELRASKLQFELFMDNLPYAVVIKDESKKVIYANKNVQKYMNKDIIGHTSTENLGNAIGPKIDALIKKATKDGKAEEIMQGKLYDKNYIAHVLAFRIPQNNGKIYTGLIYVDITDRKQAENRQQSLGRIIDESLNEIYIFDQKSLKFLYANKGAKKNIGYTFEELMELTPMDIDPQMTAENFSNIATQLERDDTKSVSFSTVIQRKNGTIYPIEIYLQSNVYENQNTYVAIIIDTTEREANRRELLDKEEIMIAQSRHAAMGEMIGMIAHQWRQPISVIAMGANNLLVDIDEADRVPLKDHR